MRQILRQILDAFRHMIFPRRCVGCGTLDGGLTGAQPLCSACLSVWMQERAVVCMHCGQTHMLCRCRPSGAAVPASALQFYHLLPYAPGSKQTSVSAAMILRLKTKLDRDALRFLAAQTAPLCECAVMEADGCGKEDWILTYPPRSAKHVSESGFDQSALLARELSYLTGIPFVRCFTRKQGKNTAQKSLNAQARRENAESSYRLHRALKPEALRGRRVLLVDDILTTGATMAACAEMLITAGAASCACVTIAKTARSHP